MGLFALLAAAGGWLVRHGMRRHAMQYVGGCAAVGLMSLLLVTVDNLYTRGAQLHGCDRSVRHLRCL